MKLSLAALLGLTLLRLLVAATVPLVPDEAYYWMWSRNLQFGYFDHPPMVAAWIRAGTLFAGSTPLGVRFLGPLSVALASTFLWRAGEDFFPGRRAGLVAAWLYNATLIAGAGSVIMTPDQPQLFFWIAATAALGRWLATQNPRWWLVVGCAAGGALLSKYTGLILVASVGLWLLTTRDGRMSLPTPWPWAGLALALAIFAPNLAWNAAHGWVSYLKQGGRVAHFAPLQTAQSLVEYVGGQIGFATPLVFLLSVVGVWRLARQPDAGSRLLLWLTLLPALVFAEHTISGRVEGNWPEIVHPSAWIAAGGLAVPVMARWLKPALGLGFAMSVLVYAEAWGAPSPMPAARNPVALQMGGWTDFSKNVSSRPTPFLTADDYETVSELAFHASPGTVVAAFGPRWEWFDLPKAEHLAGQSGILVTRKPDEACGTIARKRGADVIKSYRACPFVAPTGGVLLPRP